jgi:transposase
LTNDRDGLSASDPTLKPDATSVRGVEVSTETGRQRQFSEDFKAGIVEETLVPGAVFSAVARRHALTPQQVFTCAGKATSGWRERGWPKFVPAVVEAALPVRPCVGAHASEARADRGSVSIEMEIEGFTVRIGYGAEAKTLAAVLEALKAGT